MSQAKALTMSPELQDQIEAAKEQAGRMKLDLKMSPFLQEEMEAAKEWQMGRMKLDLPSRRRHRSARAHAAHAADASQGGDLFAA
jgi:hypothetical protein